MNFDIELTSTPITSHAGLAFIGEELGEAKFERHMETIGPANPRSDRIPDADLAKTMVGLICCGKPHYDAAGEYTGDPYFPQALGLDRLPSPAILRQRIEALPAEAGEALRGFTSRLLAAHPGQLTEEHQGQQYMTIHVDVTPMDNSGTHKEGVWWSPTPATMRPRIYYCLREPPAPSMWLNTTCENRTRPSGWPPPSGKPITRKLIRAPAVGMASAAWRWSTIRKKRSSGKSGGPPSGSPIPTGRC